jgi:hypothetical protein
MANLLTFTKLDVNPLINKLTSISNNQSAKQVTQNQQNKTSEKK